MLSAFALPARAEDAQRAKEYFQQGSTLFNVGDFDKAIEAWQAGYKEKPDPTFLYNIGQAYRLKGDTQKALFFYRGYLRNAPKGAFRTDVEAKIAALQKGAEPKPTAPAPEPATKPATAPPPAPTTPAPTGAAVVPVTPAPVPAPKPVAPPPAEAPPLPEPMSPAGDLGAVPPPPLTTAPSDEKNRNVDLQFALGFDAFTSGVNVSGSVPPQLGLAFAGGYTFGDDSRGVRFRLGAFLGYTSLTEKVSSTSNKLGFTSALLEPSLRFRVVPRRVAITAGIGLGALSVSNLKPNSVLLQPGKASSVSGSIGLFEARFAAGVQVNLTPAVILTATPALSVSPKHQTFYGTLGRFELLFGVGWLF
ncbi:MAG TPA: tetratricopeptide repeat protein [Polyangia bacterium]|nr:tetratricopeptide repeat protein [Polyangia bacterium]